MSYIGQNEDEWEAEERKKAKKAKKDNLKKQGAKPCIICNDNRLFLPKGLAQHLASVHSVKIVEEPKVLYKVEKL